MIRRRAWPGMLMSQEGDEVNASAGRWNLYGRHYYPPWSESNPRTRPASSRLSMNCPRISFSCPVDRVILIRLRHLRVCCSIFHGLSSLLNLFANSNTGTTEEPILTAERWWNDGNWCLWVSLFITPIRERVAVGERRFICLSAICGRWCCCWWSTSMRWWMRNSSRRGRTMTRRDLETQPGWEQRPSGWLRRALGNRTPPPSLVDVVWLGLWQLDTLMRLNSNEH